jgi:hypothetical protein
MQCKKKIGVDIQRPPEGFRSFVLLLLTDQRSGLFGLVPPRRQAHAYHFGNLNPASVLEIRESPRIDLSQRVIGQIRKVFITWQAGGRPPGDHAFLGRRSTDQPIHQNRFLAPNHVASPLPNHRGAIRGFEYLRDGNGLLKHRGSGEGRSAARLIERVTETPPQRGRRARLWCNNFSIFNMPGWRNRQTQRT